MCASHHRKYGAAGWRRGQDLLHIALGLQVRLQPAQQRHAVATLPLQGPVAVQPLHELALSRHREVAGDLTQPGHRGAPARFRYSDHNL